MFFAYHQNNSFGEYDYSYEQGLSAVVLVEGDSANDANERAEGIGLYFDGAGDCPCCGDRWYAVWDDEVGTETPMVYDQPAEHWVSLYSKLIDDGWEGFIHYQDGRKVGFWGPDRDSGLERV